MARSNGLPQYLNYLGFVAEGVMLLRDGAFLTCFEYAGADRENSEFDLMHHEADQFAQELSRLGNGWMLEFHTVRAQVQVSPAAQHCPDTTSAMVYEERAQRYATAGRYYGRRNVLVLTYLPPAAVRRQVSHYFFEDGKPGALPPRSELLQTFIDKSEEFTKALGHVVTLRRLNDDQATHFLRSCVTGEDRGVGIAADKADLHYAIGSVSLAPHAGIVGQLHTRVIGVIGWPGDGTIPQMFEPLLRLPFSLRMQQRFITLSPQDAVRELKKKYNDWVQLNTYNPKRMFWAFLAPLTGASADDRRVVQVNTDAELQAASVEREIAAVQSGTVRLGYYTMSVVVHDEDRKQVEANAAAVVAEINRLGFTALIETDNAADAFAGSWAGHGLNNVRKYFLNTRHLARLIPTSTPWRGEDHAPCSFYPEGSGPLVITTSSGQTPFALNVHKQDLGNFLIVGPSGAGKTYAIGSLCLAFRQYANSQINLFDRGYGAIIPTLACGGQVYDTDAMLYAPLQHVDEEEERTWALRFIETLATLRDFVMTPQARKDLQHALEILGKGALQYRTMTGFHAQLQTTVPGLKAALEFYTLGKGGRILDGTPGPEQESSWLMWEMEKLLGQGDAISTPVLMHLIHTIQRRLDGRPTLTIIEEGWQAAANEWLQAYTEESSANYRKQVNALGLVLHSPANLKAFKRHELLLTNISTIIFLPNPRANTEGEEGQRAHYEAMGLGRREIRMLAEGLRPKRDYYLVQGEDRRVFQFESGPFEHAILGKNGRDYRARVLALREQYGNDWLPVWLAEQGHSEFNIRRAA